MGLSMGLSMGPGSGIVAGPPVEGAAGAWHAPAEDPQDQDMRH